ncbi:hypothetical protein MJC1_02028 [Methylocystis sp. MJC1]|nr:hypothetical protein MJC1_02028 [Methylocystis sp. MJC1]
MPPYSLKEESLALPDISFETIRPHDDSRNSGFEELCAQLASLEPAEPNSAFFRKGRGGDAGVECFLRQADGSERGWQAKYLFTWDASLSQQLSESIETALIKHPKLTDYIVCLPFDLPDVKPAKGLSALAKWETWKAKWEKTAKEAERKLQIYLWDKSALSSRLSRDDAMYAGRLIYWFGVQSLTKGWFEDQFEKARAGLGSRYTPESNVELPVRQKFLSLVRDPKFGKALARWATGLREKGSSTLRAIKEAVPVGEEDNHTRPLEQALDDLTDRLRARPVEADTPLPLQEWSDSASRCLACARSALSWTFGIPPGKPRSSGIDPQRWAQHNLHRLLDLLSEVRDSLDSDVWHLANCQAVLLEGPAGIGKSHLLADVVEHQIHLGRPALLVLGSSLTDSEPWRQIMAELDLPSTQQVKHFLGSMDAVAQAAGVRALICVDALNERHGLDIWPTRLAAFLKTVEPFKNVGVALSCRSTFVAHVVPEDVDEAHLARIEHPGFGGESGAAAKMYLSKRGVVRPGAPNLVPEFENPLFLKTCCDFLEREGRRELPRGLLGVTAIFGFYNEAVAKQLSRRMKLDPALGIVKSAIDGFAKLLLDARQNYVTREDAIKLFEQILPSGGRIERCLLTQLESEGLLSVEMVRQDDDSLRAMVRFTFERFSDHAIASRVLDEHLALGGVDKAFADGTRLREIVFGEESYRYAGIIEALAVQLPERADVELLDVGKPTWETRNAFEESLLWRDQAHFSDRTFELVREFLAHRESDVLLSVATEPANKFNALYLDKRLRDYSMPERDGKWSLYVADHGDNEGGAIETLITWGLENGTEAIEADRAELAAIALGWLLSTSNRWVRDRATKSLAVIFAKRLDLAASILRRFNNVDDLYVLERLYAGAYGAVLQGVASNCRGELAATVFDLVFAKGTPPANILLRDNAYGIIKYVEMRGELPAIVDQALFEPPYKSPWPPERVPDRIIESFTMDYGKGQRFTDAIVSSTVHDGDFARYVIDSRLHDWSPEPIGSTAYPTYREVCLSWVREFEESATPEQISALSAILDAAATMEGTRLLPRGEKDALDLANDHFQSLLTEEQWEDYRVRAKHFIAFTLFAPHRSEQQARFNTQWTRRWICKRAHDLGWTAERFGQRDRGRGSDRHDHRVERIGKKYQWLALYELAARMSDNLAFLGGYGDYQEGEDRGYGSARELRMRDIDPSLLVTRTNYDSWAQWERTWWVPMEPKLQSVSPSERIAWLNSDQDVVNDASLIDVLNPKTKQRWLCLHAFASWRQQGMVDDREELERDTWFRLHCVVVKKEDEKKLLRDLSKKTLTDPHGLPHIELHGDYFLGEYPWHPSVNRFGDWTVPGEWRARAVPTRATVADYMCERGGYDYSLDETVHVELPAPWLASALRICLSDGRKLNYVDVNGNVVFYDPSVTEIGPQAALVDRNAFLAMLEREGLAAVWVIAGEKSVYGGRDAFGGRALHTAVYHLDSEGFKRQIHREREDPSPSQLQALFWPEKVPLGLTVRSSPKSQAPAKTGAAKPKSAKPKARRQSKKSPASGPASSGLAILCSKTPKR